MKNRNFWLLFMVGGVMILFLAGSGFGAAQPAAAQSGSIAPINAVVPEQHTISSPLVISAAGFAADGYSPAAQFFSFGGGYIRGDSCWQAPVYLPQRARIVGFYASLYDNDATLGNDPWVDFYRLDNYTGVTTFLGGVTSISNGDYIQVVAASVSEALNQVVYPQYSYYMGSCGYSNANRLYSARVYFNLQFYLPTVSKK